MFIYFRQFEADVLLTSFSLFSVCFVLTNHLLLSGKKKKKKEVGPKRARSAYILFCGDHRSAVDGAFGEKTKKLSEMWRNADDAARKASITDSILVVCCRKTVFALLMLFFLLTEIHSAGRRGQRALCAREGSSWPQDEIEKK